MCMLQAPNCRSYSDASTGCMSSIDIVVVKACLLWGKLKSEASQGNKEVLEESILGPFKGRRTLLFSFNQSRYLS